MTLRGKISTGRDFNYFTKLEISSTTFQDDCDIVIPFTPKYICFLNEESGAGKICEYSCNGWTLHGDLDPQKTSIKMEFYDRVVSKVWFRVAAGSTGPLTIRVEAYGLP